MGNALEQLVTTLAGPALLVMLGVIVVLLRQLIRKDRVIGDTVDKLMRQNGQMLEFMRTILGGKRWRKVDSDEAEEKR